MRNHQPQTSGHARPARKRGRKNNTALESYIHQIAEQIATTGRSYVNGETDPSQSQDVWLKIVKRLRQEVFNTPDGYRGHTLPRSQLLSSAPPPSCSVCRENKARAKTMCMEFVCFECLCKLNVEGPSKKVCPWCNAVQSKSHITFLDDANNGNNSNNRSASTMEVGLIPFHRPAETQTISTPPSSLDEQPTWSTSLIAQLESCASALLLDHNEELFDGTDLSSNAGESSSSSMQWLNSADFAPRLCDTLDMNIGAESSPEVVEMRGNQDQELEQFTCSSNIVAAVDSLNDRDLDSILNESICDWSLLDELLHF